MTQAQALNILKTGANVFLTGEPGSGKTYTVNDFVSYLRRRKIQPAITASTGIAATHICGTTIHSWSGIGIRHSLDKYEIDRIASIERIVRRIENTYVLIIDEISMLSADALSMVDAVCRDVRHSPDQAFGGLQVIFVGDFFQLPPVTESGESSIARFAYESPAWAAADPVICYLTEQYRQDDQDFLDLLKAIRGNEFAAAHERYIAARETKREMVASDVPRFFPHNADVDRLNQEMLHKISGQEKKFVMSEKGRAKLVESLKKGCLSPEVLSLKPGAAVMFTKNNSKSGYVNGTLGVVQTFDSTTGLPIVRTRSGRAIRVDPADWNLEENGRVRARITQLPLRLAWAITVHKSQGMSLDEAAMDLSTVFEYGQGYVALSRVRRLAGLYIFGWNEMAFRVHPEILSRDRSFREASNAAELALMQTPPATLAKNQNDFALRCGGGPETDEEESSMDDPDTYTATLVLWNDRKSVAEIAQRRALKETTILSHIEKLVARGHIEKAGLSRLLTPALSSALPEIHAAFAELGAEKLAPVNEKFSHKYSYDALRIARIIFEIGP